MIGHIKSIKMSGLAQKLSNTISNLRLVEMNAAGPLRTVAAVTSSIAQIPLMISPVAAFAMFTIVSNRTGETLDANRMFAALSLIVLLTQPLFWMFEVVLNLGGASACFNRIEKYLTGGSRTEYREFDVIDRRTSPALQDASGSASTELQVLRKSSVPISVQKHAKSISRVALRSASFSWSAEGPTVLEDISFDVRDAEMAVLVGPVASGKTSLLKGLLGEVPCVKGQVYLSGGRYSWCEQSPWLIVSIAIILVYRTPLLTLIPQERNHSKEHNWIRDL